MVSRKGDSGGPVYTFGRRTAAPYSSGSSTAPGGNLPAAVSWQATGHVREDWRPTSRPAACVNAAAKN